MPLPYRPLEPGDKRDQIIVQTAARAADTDGAELLQWPPDGGSQVQIWAEWCPGGTREAWLAQQRLSSFVDGVFRVDAIDLDDLDPEPTAERTRILAFDQVYDVKPLIDDSLDGGVLAIPVVAHGK